MQRILSDRPSWGYERRAVTATTTVVAADRGYTIDCTSGTYDVALTAAATLGAGFPFAVYNSGSGTITVNPSGAETIRSPAGSAATLVLAQGQGALFLCDGTGFEVIASAGLPPTSGSIFPINVPDDQFSIIGSASPNRTMKFEVDAQAANADLTINSGAQTADRTLSVPVLTGNRTLAVLEQAQTFTAAQTIAPAASVDKTLSVGVPTASTYFGLNTASIFYADNSAWGFPCVFVADSVGRGAIWVTQGFSTATNSGNGAYLSFTSATATDLYLYKNGSSAVVDTFSIFAQRVALAQNAGAIGLSVANTTNSTSKDTGSVVIEGGFAAEKNIIGAMGRGTGTATNATLSGTITLTATSAEVQTFTGAVAGTVVQFPAANLFGAGISVLFTVNNQSSVTVTPTRAGADTFQGGGTTDPVLAGATTRYASNGVSVWLKV